MEWVAAGALSSAIGALVAAAAVFGFGFLPNLTATTVDDNHEPEILNYHDLRTPRFALLVGGTAAAATFVTFTLVPVTIWAPWLVLATLGAVLAGVDAATMWLPNSLMYPFWVLITLSAIAVVALAGIGAGWQMVTGALIWGVLFYLIWRFSRQIGFGDVRLAFALGAISGSAGWVSLYLCLILGTLVGAIWGTVQKLRTGQGKFPYGPALYAGCVLTPISFTLLQLPMTPGY